MSNNLEQHFYCQLRSHRCSLDLLFSQFLGICPGCYFLCLHSSRIDRLSLPSCRTLRSYVVELTTIQISPICKHLCSLFWRNISPACAGMHGCWSQIFGHCSAGGSRGIFSGSWGAGGRGDMCPSPLLRCGLLRTLWSHLVIPLLT